VEESGCNSTPDSSTSVGMTNETVGMTNEMTILNIIL
jgi:hypothetical protein